MKALRYAVVGATGMVGEGILAGLAELGVEKVFALASERSVGQQCMFGETVLTVQQADTFDFSAVDIAFFAVGAETSLSLAPKAVSQGAWVIDKSSAFRMDPQVPLVVPEVNKDCLPVFDRSRPQIIASPNCMAVPLVMALNALESVYTLMQVQVSTYQSVSGSGRKGVEALLEESCLVLNARPLEPRHYAQPIAFNCIPCIDEVTDTGETVEEQKIREETKRILDASWQAQVTAVRVPSFYSHAASICVQTKEPINIFKLQSAWEAQSGVTYCAQAEDATGIQATGNDQVWLSRARLQVGSDNRLAFWLVTDNLRKGAASQALHILQHLCHNTDTVPVI